MSTPSKDLEPESLVRWGDVSGKFSTMQKQIKALQHRVKALENKTKKEQAS